jgi:hypothetical protein
MHLTYRQNGFPRCTGRAIHTWSPELGQWVKLGSLPRRTDLGDGQAETVFG